MQRRPSRQSLFRWDQALVPPTVVPDYRSIEQPQWDLLLAFIHQTTERFLPSPSSEMQGNFFDAPPPEDLKPRTHGRKTPHYAGSLRNIISGRSLCWLSRPAPSCW